MKIKDKTILRRKKRPMFVYLVQCSDGSYYTGVSNDVSRRLAEHNSGMDSRSYTFNRRPVRLVYSQYYDDPRLAMAAEKQIKGWKRNKKEALIRGDWEQLKVLAKCLNETRHRRR